MPTDELKAFLSTLGAEVRDRAHAIDGTPEFTENAFTEYLLDWLEENGVVANARVIHHEGRWNRAVMKVNGYAISDDEDVLDVFASLYLGQPEQTSLPRDELLKAATRATKLIEAALAGAHEGMEASSDAFSMLKHIHSTRASLAKFRVVLITDGVVLNREVESERVDSKPVSYEVWDLERLYRGMQAGLPRNEIDIDFVALTGAPLSCLQVDGGSADYEAYLAIIPGELLFRIYEEYGARLLEQNVRSFLSARGKINSAIRKSIREEPDRFLAYNNGIVVTVDGLEEKALEDGGRGIGKVTGFQIVNGGQTTASIHRACKVDRAIIDAVRVQAKIIRIRPEKQEEIVRFISRYANSQNVIQMADFSANDPFHIEIERLSSVIWCPGQQSRWFYERARGQYQVAQTRAGATPAQRRRFQDQTPPQQKLTKTDLAKYVQSWAQKPYLVSLGSQKNFESFMQEMRQRQGATWLPDDQYYRELVAKAILFRAVSKIVRQLGIEGYKAQVVTYLVAYLSWRTGTQLDLDHIWANQAISQQLNELMRVWAPAVLAEIKTSAGTRNVTEWCKKEECWSAVSGLGLPLAEPLPAEVQGRARSAPGRATTSDGSVSAEDLENMAACRRLDGPSWLKIHAWGMQSGQLVKWQYGIAHTLSGYAAGGWERSPSPKQAKHGASIIRLAIEHGVLSENEEGAG